MSGCITVLNAGSSSIKLALYDIDLTKPALFRGQVEQIGVSPRLRLSDADGKQVAERTFPKEGFDHTAATRSLLETARELLDGRPVKAVGHRVVHGGTRFAAPIRIDPAVIDSLAALAPLAPLHQPHNLSPIRAIAQFAPDLPQVACFDTAFHRSQPPLAQLFGLPRKFTDAGVRRYGFHGLSYEYIAGRLTEVAPEIAKGRVIVAHLGNGASLCGLKNGVSVASTMGFTAVDGLLMGTRTGALDPGVVIYLMDNYGMDARAIENLIYRESGLLGVSGVSSDMRTLRTSKTPEAVEAVRLFVYRIVREIGSLAAALGGLDGLVFTGGIGEHDVASRAQIMDGCGWLGLQLDEAANASGGPLVSPGTSTIPAFVIPTDEERMIARHTNTLLRL